MLFIVDAVSAMLVEPMEPDAWGVDVVLTASQKALAIPPGLSFMSISPAAEARANQVDTHGYYFSATEALKDWRRNQTPPAGEHCGRGPGQLPQPLHQTHGEAARGLG